MYGQPKTIHLDHWLNMVDYICDPKKIENANFMREARKYVKKIFMFGLSEGGVI